jgi:nucleoside-diphosphate-sugar epimerase
MVLGTGASGHVGGAVVSRLAPLGHDVVAMVRDVHTPLVMHHASCIMHYLYRSYVVVATW